MKSREFHYSIENITTIETVFPIVIGTIAVIYNRLCIHKHQQVTYKLETHARSRK